MPCLLWVGREVDRFTDLTFVVLDAGLYDALVWGNSAGFSCNTSLMVDNSVLGQVLDRRVLD